MGVTDRFVSWPTSEQRKEHSGKVAKKGFPGCVGFADGTTIPISKRPEFQGDFYYDRYGNYSHNLQAVGM
ncbi:hypothetical protein BGX20_000312 [Mortierella sp. AD010]|nr:hypothetical protein BGX20_000312 [Mortierella sp. AD010]